MVRFKDVSREQCGIVWPETARINSFTERQTYFVLLQTRLGKAKQHY